MSQRLDALEVANRRRLKIAKARRDVAAGRLEWRDLLETDDEDLRRMTLHALLTAVPRVGPSTTNATLARLQIAPSRRIGDLTDRQRVMLAAERLRQAHGKAVQPTMTVLERAKRAERDRDRYREMAKKLARENAVLRARFDEERAA